ncbi:hypothetical protein [Silvanigrella sp.]|jgi:hypothetical protein|uniref:hypothetical protein n=1 Tax=Silvanigrella sp. TaxID=2024976 RepID=UPI0037CBBA6D|nr:hypothetical protein [Silvanigrellaceae bacterium]
MHLKRIVDQLATICIFSFIFYSCQTMKPLNNGIQEGYEAVNPASIIAVPVFLLPDPSKYSSIDPAIINTHQLVNKIQNKVMQSFSGQPNINGYAFSAVANALGTAKPTYWDKLNDSMKVVADRFNSSQTSTRLLITSSCLSRKNFMEFYTYCLAPDRIWIENLNGLAAKVLNADTALIVVITEISSAAKEDIYSINGGFSVLLVDTNNGKLIWGKDAFASLINPAEKKYFPSWDDLLNQIFSDTYWENFPGRITKMKADKK